MYFEKTKRSAFIEEGHHFMMEKGTATKIEACEFFLKWILFNFVIVNEILSDFSDQWYGQNQLHLQCKQ